MCIIYLKIKSDPTDYLRLYNVKAIIGNSSITSEEFNSFLTPPSYQQK